MAEQAESTSELQLGNVQGVPETIRDSTAQNPGAVQQDKSGNSIALNQLAEASITEEPGAGKPHAGICAGVAG